MFYARSARFFVDISRVNRDFSTFPREARFFLEYSEGKLKGFYARSASKILETYGFLAPQAIFFWLTPRMGGSPGGIFFLEIFGSHPQNGGGANSQILSGSPP